MSVRLDTSHGPISIELFWRLAPRTCRNFIELCKGGYYDGIIFHRVVPSLVLQTGDPKGDGSGGDSIYGGYFEDEIIAKLSHEQKGVVSMANSGRNTNASQFFFTMKACPHLDGTHTVFGQVTSETLTTLDAIASSKCKKEVPVAPIKIFTATVVENPWSDQPLPEGCTIPQRKITKLKEKSDKTCLIM